MTTLETLREKYLSFNPKANTYTFDVNYKPFDYIDEMYNELVDSNIFNEITPRVSFDFNNIPFGYIECHLK